MALILYLCLQVIMHLTESMCPCVFSSILLFLCLCAFLYFFPLVLDMFLSLWTSLTPSPCVTASMYITLCSCQCMNFYIWLGLQVPMQASFEMTIYVYVLALPCVSPSLCVFFFALSVPVFVCLFMCTFWCICVLSSCFSDFVYLCLAFLGPCNFWLLYVSVCISWNWPVHLFCTCAFILACVHQLWEELSMFVICCVWLSLCVSLCVYLTVYVMVHVSFCFSVTRYFHVAVSLCWHLFLCRWLYLCACVPIDLTRCPSAFWGIHWIILWDISDVLNLLFILGLSSHHGT